MSRERESTMSLHREPIFTDRLDVHLVKKNLAPSRSKAQEMIQWGHVKVLIQNQFQVTRKPSFQVNSSNSVRLIQKDILKYVARSGLKLHHAMKELQISPFSKKVLDIGLSTGGFAHCLLEHGASQVIGVDVGRGQLHPRLRNHPRLISLEGVNARLLRNTLGDRQKSFDWITVDVSFISLKHILPEVSHFLAPGGEFLCLVKPQFEQTTRGTWVKIRNGSPLPNPPFEPSTVTTCSLDETRRTQRARPQTDEERAVIDKVRVRMINLCQSSI